MTTKAKKSEQFDMDLDEAEEMRLYEVKRGVLLDAVERGWRRVLETSRLAVEAEKFGEREARKELATYRW